MTWPSVVGLALVLGGLALGWRAIKPFLERAATVQEKKAEAAIQAVAPPPPTPEEVKRDKLPAAIRMMAMDWQDEWAREQTLDFYVEVYEQTGDWNAVQSVAMADQARYLKAKGELS